MFGKKDEEIKKQMHVEIENLAVPEVRFGEQEQEEEKENEGEMSIDYSGAIPEIHIKKN